MDTDGARVVARAPAKINLVLAVGPLRPDGYHELATVFHALDLYDEVVAYPSEEIGVTVRGLHADRVPADESNLAVRAAAALAEYAGVRTGVQLDVHKRIPVAGGLAGGSADAAAALVACDDLWDTGLGRGELALLAERVGSDVPFALAGGTSLGSGRGEQLTAVMVGGTFHWVVAIARGGLPTPRVYAELDRLRADRPVGRPAVGHDVLTALRAGDPEALGASMHNDLQEAACSLQPALRTALDTGMDFGAVAGVVSGSGPTCVFLARDGEHAEDLAAGLAASGVCADAWVVTGPAPGARLA
jgi:4-diphosphocytidyl-2-C-methyl-D-erythritol kinase